MTNDNKRSDTSLMNFMQNYRVSVRYDGGIRRWVSKSMDSLTTGMGNSIRSSLVDLERNIKSNG